jgi:hypothetical protein
VGEPLDGLAVTDEPLLALLAFGHVLQHPEHPQRPALGVPGDVGLAVHVTDLPLGEHDPVVDVVARATCDGPLVGLEHDVPVVGMQPLRKLRGRQRLHARRQAEDLVRPLRVADLERRDVALPVPQARDALCLHELLLALANVPVGEERPEGAGETVADLDEQALLLLAPRPRVRALVQAEDPRRAGLRVDRCREDRARRADIAR